MKIIAISDTHNLTPDLPEGDILIHAGDATMSGTHEEIHAFTNWLKILKKQFKYILFTPGNHDYYFESWQKDSIVMDGGFISVINDSIRIGGINFWLSPYSNIFGSWAFMKDENGLAKIWDEIPKNTDVVVTHGPPKGFLDKTIAYGNVCAGSQTLLDKILEIRPKVCIFGHIHEGYGEIYNKNIHYINASIVNEYYQNVNKPVEINI